MKIEFLDNLSDGGKFKDIVAQQLIRLYDFDQFQAGTFRDAIREAIIDGNKALDLSKLEFITPINCNLILQLASNDIGITTHDKKNFICEMTIGGYETMINLLEPFCIKESSGYQWLCDTDAPVEFLFSPGGTW